VSWGSVFPAFSILTIFRFSISLSRFIHRPPDVTQPSHRPRVFSPLGSGPNAHEPVLYCPGRGSCSWSPRRRTSGFEQFFIRTILGTNGAIRIETRSRHHPVDGRAAGSEGGSNFRIAMRNEGKKYIEGIEEPKLLTDALRRFENVAGVSSVLRGGVFYPEFLPERSGSSFRHQPRRSVAGVRSRTSDCAGILMTSGVRPPGRYWPRDGGSAAARRRGVVCPRCAGRVRAATG